MTPLQRLHIEKAASDCGFEMTPLPDGDAMVLRSARFPESVRVRHVDADSFVLTVSDPRMLGLDGDGDGDGDGVTVDGHGALYELLCTVARHARTRPNRVADAFRRDTGQLPRGTEAERLVLQRIGQDLFRAALLDYWQGRCCLSGLDIPELLRASHIKPWAACASDDERLDVFNGLLLAPQLDALFDGGWMTVDSDGVVRLSPSLPERARQALGVATAMPACRLHPAHAAYLAFHARHVFRAA